MSNRKFMCLQASGPSTAPKKEMTPSDMESMFSAFNAWREKYSDQIIDMGGQLVGDAVTVGSNGQVDGPLAEVKELIGGYMIVTATDMNEALQIAQESPGCRGAGTVTIREIATS